MFDFIKKSNILYESLRILIKFYKLLVEIICFIYFIYFYKHFFQKSFIFIEFKKIYTKFINFLFLLNFLVNNKICIIFFMNSIKYFTVLL